MREIKIMSNGFKDFVGKVPRFDRKEIIWIDLLTPDGHFIFRFVFGACECLLVVKVLNKQIRLLVMILRVYELLILRLKRII